MSWFPCEDVRASRGNRWGGGIRATKALKTLRTDPNNVAIAWPPIPRRRYGVPIGGPFDEFAFRTALALLGEEEGQGLEVGFFGGEWEAEQDLIVAMVGPPRENNAQNQSLFTLAKGQHLTLGAPREGHRSYLTWAQAKPIHPVRLAPEARSKKPIRFIPLSDIPIAGRELAVTPNINRIGLRLSPVAQLAHEIELPSEPQCPGAIQITRDGTPIIIGPDGPTIGGYPKAGVVISADMGVVAQLKPGDILVLKETSVEEAREAAREREAAWRRALAEIRISVRTSRNDNHP